MININNYEDFLLSEESYLVLSMGKHYDAMVTKEIPISKIFNVSIDFPSRHVYYQVFVQLLQMKKEFMHFKEKDISNNNIEFIQLMTEKIDNVKFEIVSENIIRRNINQHSMPIKSGFIHSDPSRMGYIIDIEIDMDKIHKQPSYRNKYKYIDLFNPDPYEKYKNPNEMYVNNKPKKTNNKFELLNIKNE